FVATLSLPPAHAGAYCVVDHADGWSTLLEGYVLIVHRLTFTHVARESPAPWRAATFGHKLDPKCRNFVLAALLPVLPFPGAIAETAFDEHWLPLTQILPAAFSLLSKHHDIDEAGIIFPLISLFHPVIHC